MKELIKTIIITTAIFLFFSAALLYGLYGISYTVHWVNIFIGKQLALKIAKGMIFFGLVGFFTAISMLILTTFKTKDPGGG